MAKKVPVTPFGLLGHCVILLYNYSPQQISLKLISRQVWIKSGALEKVAKRPKTSKSIVLIRNEIFMTVARGRKCKREESDVCWSVNSHFVCGARTARRIHTPRLIKWWERVGMDPSRRCENVCKQWVCECSRVYSKDTTPKNVLSALITCSMWHVRRPLVGKWRVKSQTKAVNVASLIKRRLPFSYTIRYGCALVGSQQKQTHSTPLHN